MPGPLQGRVAIVTGAGSPIGMGRAMALALVEAGARVAMMDVDRQALDQTASELKTVAGSDAVLCIVGSVSQSADAAMAVQRTISELGGLDILVNNAGINLRRPDSNNPKPWQVDFWKTTPEQWDHLMGINLSGQFYMAQAAVTHMLERHWGRIVGVTTSLEAMVGKGTVPYGPSKAGHEALVAVMAKDLEGSGVTANVLVPGGSTNTNLVPPEIDRTGWIQPEVMQAPIVWLASEESGDISGRRLIAKDWDESLPIQERLQRASAPAGWPSSGS